MLKDDCIFCKIIKGEIPSQKVYEDGKMLVFKDIEPKAKVHLLAVAKTHFKLLSEMNGEDAELLKYMLCKIPADRMSSSYTHTRRRNSALVKNKSTRKAGGLFTLA